MNTNLSNLDDVFKPVSGILCEKFINEIIEFFDETPEFAIDNLTDFIAEIDLLTKPGIYVFEFKISSVSTLDKWIENEWSDSDLKYIPIINNAYKKEITGHEWACLYIGKSETSIKTRIKQHVGNKTKNVESTYALKILNRSRLTGHTLFRVKYLIIDKKKYKYYKLILVILEHLLHDRLKPLFGSR